MSASTITIRHTQLDIHTLPSRLLLQHSKHSCQNSRTSNTTIARWLGRTRDWQREMRGKEMLKWHLWTTQVGPPAPTVPSFLSLMWSTSFSFRSLPLNTPPFCSRHEPLLSHISSHNSSGKTSLNLTPRMWVHTSERSNNTEILQIRSCQIKGGISGAHPSLRRGQLAQGHICMSKYAEWLTLHHKLRLERGLWVSYSLWDLFLRSQVQTRVRNPHGMQGLANQNFWLNCSKQVLLGWIGCNNIFSPFTFQILGKKNNLSTVFIFTGDATFGHQKHVFPEVESNAKMHTWCYSMQQGWFQE